MAVRTFESVFIASSRSRSDRPSAADQEQSSPGGVEPHLGKSRMSQVHILRRRLERQLGPVRAAVADPPPERQPRNLFV